MGKTVWKIGFPVKGAEEVENYMFDDMESALKAYDLFSRYYAVPDSLKKKCDVYSVGTDSVEYIEAIYKDSFRTLDIVFNPWKKKIFVKINRPGFVYRPVDISIGRYRAGVVQMVKVLYFPYDKDISSTVDAAAEYARNNWGSALVEGYKEFTVEFTDDTDADDKWCEGE